MTTKKTLYNVVLAVFFDDWVLDLEETKHGIQSPIEKIEYIVKVASSTLTEAPAKAKEALASHIEGLRIKRISLLSIDEDGEVFV